MVRTRARHKEVAEIAELIWPTFFEHSGCVFASSAASNRIRRSHRAGRRLELGDMDKTGTEAFENHVHLLDVLPQSRTRSKAQRTRIADLLGRTMAEAWFAKLQRDFPAHRFRVYYSRRDEPIVRFHRVYPGEPAWLDESDWRAEIASGGLVVLDTSSRTGRGLLSQQRSNRARRRSNTRLEPAALSASGDGRRKSRRGSTAGR